MLKSFTIEHKTDGETKCTIYVEPGKRWLSGTVTVDGVIKREFTEKEPGVFNDVANHWRDLDYFERKASAVAKSFSPFWRGEAPADNSKEKADMFAKVKAVMPELLTALDELKKGWTFPKAHEVRYGKKYAKIVHDGAAYAFLDSAGNIYMPASWSQPARHIRGNVFSDANYSVGKAFGEYGVVYLR